MPALEPQPRPDSLALARVAIRFGSAFQAVAAAIGVVLLLVLFSFIEDMVNIPNHSRFFMYSTLSTTSVMVVSGIVGILLTWKKGILLRGAARTRRFALYKAVIECGLFVYMVPFIGMICYWLITSPDGGNKWLKLFKCVSEMPSLVFQFTWAAACTKYWHMLCEDAKDEQAGREAGVSDPLLPDSSGHRDGSDGPVAFPVVPTTPVGDPEAPLLGDAKQGSTPNTTVNPGGAHQASNLSFYQKHVQPTLAAFGWAPIPPQYLIPVSPTLTSVTVSSIEDPDPSADAAAITDMDCTSDNVPDTAAPSASSTSFAIAPPLMDASVSTSASQDMPSPHGTPVAVAPAQPSPLSPSATSSDVHNVHPFLDTSAASSSHHLPFVTGSSRTHASPTSSSAADENTLSISKLVGLIKARKAAPKLPHHFAGAAAAVRSSTTSIGGPAAVAARLHERQSPNTSGSGSAPQGWSAASAPLSNTNFDGAATSDEEPEAFGIPVVASPSNQSKRRSVPGLSSAAATTTVLGSKVSNVLNRMRPSKNFSSASASATGAAQ